MLTARSVKFVNLKYVSGSILKLLFCYLQKAQVEETKKKYDRHKAQSRQDKEVQHYNYVLSSVCV